MENMMLAPTNALNISLYLRRQSLSKNMIKLEVKLGYQNLYVDNYTDFDFML